MQSTIQSGNPRRGVRGPVLALATAALLAAQEPLAGPAAQKFNAVQYVLVTQLALALAAPFLLLETQARRDFVAIVTSAGGLTRLVGLMLVGLAGLAFYNMSLSHTHPVVVTAILNLSPFWAAAVARLVSGVRIPAGPIVFGVSLLVALVGAITVAYSQTKGAESGVGSVMQALRKGSWYFAIPVPLFTALSGSLIEAWFAERRDSAAIAAALLVSALVVGAGSAVYLWVDGVGFAVNWRLALLLAAAAILASAVGRLTYQVALRDTGGDNGFVTMFFLLAPALAGAYSWALSPWISSLKFAPNASYFVGLLVTGAALLFFARRAAGGQADKAAEGDSGSSSKMAME